MSATVAAAALSLYTGALFAAAWISRRRISSFTDYLVAGRRLGVGLATAGLLATWFGAGTLLASAEEVRDTGLRAAALEPVGPGICLLLVGLFYAARLRRSGLLTLSDFFARRFDRKSEIASAVLMVASFFGWIAAQFTVLAALLETLFGIPPGVGLLVAFGVTVGYTLIGGMWSVTLTDAAQAVVVAVGLGALFLSAMAELGAPGGGGFLAGVFSGLERLVGDTPPHLLEIVPSGGEAFAVWAGLLVAGALGNIPGQDVLQRVFAAKSEAVARRACLLSGSLYLVLGLLPVGLGLAVRLLAPGESGEILDLLARILFSPPAALALLLVVVSALLSTADSALLSAGSVLSQNLLRHAFPGASRLLLSRLAVLIVGAGSLYLAHRGLSAYALLEDAYELTLVGLFIPLTIGLYSKRGGPGAAIAAIAAGAGLWALHLAADWSFFLDPLLVPAGVFVPGAVGLTAASAAGYLIAARFEGRRERAAGGAP